MKVFIYYQRLYHERFAEIQKGACGITLNIHWAEPKDPSKVEDLNAAQRYLQFNFGWFAHPILKDGKYPTIMREQIDNKSKRQGKCRLFERLFASEYLFLKKNLSIL